MQKSTLILFFIFCFFVAFSQDIDVFHKKQNDNFKFEEINPQMSFNEYQILSRDLRMKEMLYAMIVPGYVHFYAQDKLNGYGILALRTLAFGELAYMLSSDKIDYSLSDPLSFSYDELDIPKTELFLTYSSIAIIFGTYLYDWIHGQYILKKKQEQIRYKYNMKMNLSLISSPNNKPVPGLTFNLQF